MNRGRSAKASKAEQIIEIDRGPAIGPLRLVTTLTLLASPCVRSTRIRVTRKRISLALIACTCAARRSACVTGCVLFRIDYAVVGLVDLIHALGGLGVVRVQIRMILTRLLAVGLLYFIRRRTRTYAQNLVWVLNHVLPCSLLHCSVAIFRNTARCAAHAHHVPEANAQTHRL